MQKIVAADNPELANNLVEKMLAGEVDEAPQPAPHETTELPDFHVELPGGYQPFDGPLITSAEVRELTGYDEEAMAKAVGSAKLIQTILKRGVVELGGQKPTDAMLDALTVPDREALLLGIRIATYGHEVPLEAITCRSCLASLDITIDLRNDVETVKLPASEHRFLVQLAKGNAEVHMPDGTAQTEYLAASDKTEAEKTTVMLRHTVDTINGTPVFNDDAVRRLSARDRATIINELASRAFGHRLGEVKVVCPACDEDIETPLSILGLFPL